MKNFWKAFGSFLCLAGIAPSASAQIITNPGTGSARPYGGFTLGLAFNVGSSDENVTALGVWVGSSTLAGDIQVGIWDLSGAPVASATIPAGSSSNLGQFDYVSITPVTLFGATGYELGAFALSSDTSDNLHDASSTPTFDPAFNSFQARYDNNVGTFGPPTSNGPGTAYVGPNFLFEPVPEPSSMLLTAVACLAGTRLIVRRRK